VHCEIDAGRTRKTRRTRRMTSASSDAPPSISPYEAGLGHLQASRPRDTQAYCKQALASALEQADSLHLMGLLSLDATHYDRAVEWISRAIRCDPKPLYLTSLGAALLAQARYEEALQVFDKAVQLKPDDAELWNNLGSTLRDAKRPADAILTFQQVLRLDPGHWDAACQAGLLLLELGRYEEALSYLDLCEKLQPKNTLIRRARAVALDNLAGALHAQKRFEEALALSRQAYELNPANADICNNLAASLRSLCRDEEALPWLDKAIELDPTHLHALSNKTRTLREFRRFEEAIAIHLRMKAFYPDDYAGDRGIEHIHLLTGNFEAGWARREAQWKARVRPNYYPNFSQPIWLGKEPVEGKTLLVYADEGLGDTIQFARYVPMVAALGAHVILVIHDSLHTLMSALPGVSQCLPKSLTPDAWPAFDVHCPICALPLAFPRSLDAIPSTTPYLPPPQPSRVRAWEDRLGPHDRLRVGLAWSGNPAHDNDHNRSIPLRMFSELLDAHAMFVSLNKNANPTDKAVLRETSIVDLTGDLTDFVETVALVSCLDLVITVDTSVAHLAGALARPTWILLPHTPDYRWLLDREDSPWYPTAKLFRQDVDRDYAIVLRRVRDELQARMATFRPEALPAP
jgi:tetratricopeptide (TPR) repeat protein